LEALTSGLYLSGADLAKIGYLYLHEGMWDGKQIVSKEWVKESLTPAIDAEEGFKKDLSMVTSGGFCRARVGSASYYGAGLRRAASAGLPRKRSDCDVYPMVHLEGSNIVRSGICEPVCALDEGRRMPSQVMASV
jgi:CubicO group peptidase (beta-lactamase class C family)